MASFAPVVIAVVALVADVAIISVPRPVAKRSGETRLVRVEAEALLVAVAGEADGAFIDAVVAGSA